MPGLARALGSSGAYLARAMPDVASDLPAVTPAAESEHARLGLFEAMRSLLQQATKDRVAVIIIDDLHAADAPSLELLAMLAPEIARWRLVVVGAVRDSASRPISATEELAHIARHAERLVLAGLDRQAVAAMVADMTATPATPQLVSEIHQLTDGVPLFVRELVRLLAAGGAGMADGRPLLRSVPDGVRHTIRARLAPLSSDVRGLLEQAAVLGRRFDPSLLGEMSGTSPEKVLASLGDAAAVGIVEEQGGDGRGYTFTHALFREALYRGLSPARRTDLHREAGRTMERHFASDPGPQLADIAHHFLRAAGDGAEQGVEYAVRAGDWAFEHLAYADAADRYEDALRALELLSPRPRRRCEILIRLGRARFRAGKGEPARAAFAQAIEVARETGDGEHLAEAAIGYAPFVLSGGFVDESRVAALEEALAMVGPREHRLRAELLARLAVELYFADPIERADALSQQAVAEARRQEDDRVLAETLITRHFLLWRPLGSENLGQRRELGQRIQELTRTIGDPELRLRGRVWHLQNLLEGGDRTAFDHELAALARAAEDLRLPAYLSLAAMWRATRALLRGDFERAAHCSQEARRIAEQSHAQVDIQPIAEQSFGVQQYLLHRERGRLADLEPLVKATVEALPHMRGWQSGLALLYVETGQPDDARREFEQLAVDDFASLRKDIVWFNAMATLAAVCSALDDADRAEVLYEHIRPYASAHVVVGWAVGYLGSFSHYLGQLAATMDRFDDAVAHFEDALRAHRRMAAAPWVARTEYHFAEALLARGRTADPRRAGEMAASALAAARRLGMDELSRRVGSLPSGMAGRGLVPARPSKAEPTPRRGRPTAGTFRRDGEYWTVSLGDETVLLRDAKGLRYLAVLLRHPGRELHVFDLVAATDGVAANRFPASVAEDAGLVKERNSQPYGPDGQARTAYSQRIKELEAEIAEAEMHGQRERAATLDDEQQFLAAELARVLGVGRTRASPQAERARVAVTNAIRRSIRRMGRDAPVLARHFGRAVTTGLFCSYAPAEDERVTWQR